MKNQIDRAQHLSPHEDNMEWTIKQIQLRLKEYEAYQTATEHNAEYDQLEERVFEMMAEIAHIAFHAQLSQELENDDLTANEALDTALSLVHYITSDPTDYEVIVREE